MEHRYKLSSGLWTVKEEPMFSNDIDAWNYLRKQLKGKYVTLYKRDIIKVPINNKDIVKEQFNNKYTSQTIETEYYQYKTWIPVLFGISDDEYKK